MAKEDVIGSSSTQQYDWSQAQHVPELVFNLIVVTLSLSSGILVMNTEAPQQRPKPRKIASKPKTKSGCLTCRARKVKCDEEKPKCRRCVSTGRVCDGWETPFRPYREEHKKPGIRQVSAVSKPKQTLHQFHGLPFTTAEIVEVCHTLSTKPPAHGGIGFEVEALSILHTSSSSTLVRQALACMRTFRTLLMKYGDISKLRNGNLPGYCKSITDYNTAVGNLSQLPTTAVDFHTIEVAMNCCQLFISIDIMQQQYASSIKHFVHGLRIMTACRMRPTLELHGAVRRVIPPAYRGLPAVDIFIIKLFVAPCPFTDCLMQEVSLEGTTGGQLAKNKKSPKSLELIKYRQSLASIATKTIALLDKISSLTSISSALQLIDEKEQLLNRLDVVELSMNRDILHENSSPIWNMVGLFQLLYSSVLRVVLRCSLSSSSTNEVGLSSLERDFEHLISTAESVEASSKIYLHSILH